MSTIQTYWATFRETERALGEKYPGGVLWITPTNDRKRNTCGGDAVQVTVAVAAKGIVEGTHTEATEAEIQIALEHGRQGHAISQAQTLRTNGLTKLVLGNADKP